MSTNLDDTFGQTIAKPRVVITRADILAHLRFSDKVEKETSKGLRYMSKAKASTEFFELWKTERESLRAEGYTLGEWPEGSGKWSVTKWERIPESIIIARQQASELSRATDVPTDVVFPTGPGMNLFGYQKAGVMYALARPGTLLADEPGLGKTAQAIVVSNCHPEFKRRLVICPASLKENWRREIRKWQTPAAPIFVADSKTLPDMIGWVVINYDVLAKHEEALFKIQWDFIVCDEAHYLKNPDAQRTKMVFGLKPSRKQAAAGVPAVPALHAPVRMLLTGTPICNRPKELYPLIEYLNPLQWGSKWKFFARYCDASIENGWNNKGASNLDELQDRLRNSVMVRRLKKEVLADLPPKTRRIIEFAASGQMKLAAEEERAKYGTEEDYRAAVDKLVAKASIGGGSIGERAVYRKKCAVAKAQMKVVLSYLDDAVEESEKVIIFVWHREVYTLLMAHFGSRAVGMNGDTPIPTRSGIVDEFQTNPRINVIVGQIITMGTGFTLTASSRVIMFELDDVPGNVTQCEDRAHRIGQRDNVLVEHLIVTGTIDAAMAMNCVTKQEVIEQALDLRKNGASPAPAPTTITQTSSSPPALERAEPINPAIAQLELL